MDCAPECVFLQQLFNFFNASGIDYAVMRNHESLPFSAGGHDLDIIVTPGSEDQTKIVILEAIKTTNGVAIGIAESIGFFKIYAFGSTDIAKQSWWGLRIDISVGLVFKGQRLLSEDVALPVRRYRGIAVLTDEFAGVLGVLKEVLNNSVFPECYGKMAYVAAHNDWNSIKQLLMPMGQPALFQLKSLLLSALPHSLRRSKCLQVRRSFFRYCFTRNPFSLFSLRVAYEWSKVRRLVKPPGIMVAILGTDGAGKSTLISAIEPVLSEATHGEIVIKHLRPGLLPPLSRLKGRKGFHKGPVTNPHGFKVSGQLGSLFRVIYLMIDYILGYWLVVRPKISKSPTIVLFDRYVYDIAIDPRRFRIGISSKLLHWFTQFAPKPDIVFCLYGNPEEIAMRKMELPLDEVKRQMGALIDFAEHEPRAVLVSSEGTVERTRDEVLIAFQQYLGREDK